MQDRVKAISESLEKEWYSINLLTLQEGLELMMERQRQGAPPYHFENGFRNEKDVAEFLRIERGSWVRPTYEEIIEEARLLSQEEQLHLLRKLKEHFEQEQAS